jgi:hypothetical protein
MARVPEDLAERVQRYAGRKRQTISDVLRDGLLVLLEEEDPHRTFLSDTNAATAIVSDRKEEGSDIVSDIKRDTATQEVVRTYIPSDRKEAQPASAIMSDTIPPFDSEKYVQGKLCPRGHDYHGTGRSLLRLTNRHCLACDREKFHERKQRQPRH